MGKKKTKVAGKPIDSYVKLIVPEPVASVCKLVIPAREKPFVLQALTDIRDLFGKNGQNWIQLEEHETYDVGDYHPRTGNKLTKAFDGYCLIGGVYAVDGRYENAARAAIAMAIVERDNMGLNDEDESFVEYTHDQIVNGVDTITNFNDDLSARTGWADIKAVLARAKKLVATADTK